MAIYHYKMVEVTRGDRSILTHTDELEEDLCYICHGSAGRQVCERDGRYHHHGMVHVAGGRLEAVCDTDYPAYKAEWTSWRTIGVKVNAP